MENTNNLSFKLESFEGPLDLLLHLIDKNKVDIYDIPISMITDQYLEYIKAMDQKDPDKMSEFLVMAATLLDIKAKMLIPKDEDEEGEEDDPRAELVQKLLEYKMYKYMSYELKDRAITASHSMYKEATIPDEVKQYEAPIDLDVFINGATMETLQKIFDDVMKRSTERTNFNALRMQSIKREQINIGDRVDYVKNYVKKNGNTSFRKLIEKQRVKINIIVTFLSILELMKSGDILAIMSSDGEDILLKAKGEDDDNFNVDFEIPEDIARKEQRREVRAKNKAEREAKAAEELAKLREAADARALMDPEDEIDQ